jgi:hypothetical protein
LFQLLAFADSIGSGRGIIMACLTDKQLLQMRMEVKAVEGLQQPHQPQQQQEQEQQQQAQVEHREPTIRTLDMGSTSYYFQEYEQLSDEIEDDGRRGYFLTIASGNRNLMALTPAAKHAVRAQIAAQTEQLLYTAHKLQLQELVQLVNDFVAAAAVMQEPNRPGEPLLPYDMMDQLVYR